MIYIICQDFKSTSGNHAGMRHLYQEIAKKKNDVKLYILNKKGIGIPHCNRIIAVLLLIKLIFLYRKGDKFLFTEALFKGSSHCEMIHALRLFYKKAPIYAMAHLTPSMIQKSFTEKQIKNFAADVTEIITLGSSLTLFFKQMGITNVHTSFHYVDNNYYATKEKEINKQISVIVMGAMARDFKMLAEIVKSVPQAHFDICKGHKNIDNLFEGINNVTLYGFMTENNLKELMAKADISLNVMDDTIGSNVICTSLAMGLAMICSNVGSIHDYCDESNTIFCKSQQDFVGAINWLITNPEALKKMQKQAIQASKRLSIDNYIADIWALLTKN